MQFGNFTPATSGLSPDGGNNHVFQFENGYIASVLEVTQSVVDADSNKGEDVVFPYLQEEVGTFELAVGLNTLFGPLPLKVVRDMGIFGEVPDPAGDDKDSLYSRLDVDGIVAKLTALSEAAGRDAA